MHKRSNALSIQHQHLILKRAIVTLIITLVYITLTEIPLPYVNIAPLMVAMSAQKARTLQMLTILAGGNIQQGSIMMIGLMPFIMVQLIIQVLQLGISKRLKKLAESANGQKKIGQFTKLVTLPIALCQAGITLVVLERLTHNEFIIAPHLPGELVIFCLMLIISTSTMLAVWLSDLNTIYGLGNGINYLISCSIIVSTIENIHFNPKAIMMIERHFGSTFWFVVLGSLVIFLIYNAICIWYQSSTFRLKIQFAQLTSSIDKDGSLPLSLNIANVMPIIFAGIIMNFLYTANLWHNARLQRLVNFKTWESIGFYTIILILFTYIFSYVQFYPGKLNESLDRMNAYIIGVDPTLTTVSYFKKSLFWLATINVFFYLIMVVVPMIICKLVGLPEQYVLSVSSIFIIVTTESDIRRQVAGLRAKSMKNTLI